MIFTLIYVSDSNISAFGEMAKNELTQIEKQSRFYNNLSDVRGLLLYFKQQFVQILQGEFDSVISTYGRIKDDPRHHNLRIIWFSDTDHSAFDECKMFNSMDYLANNYKRLTVQSDTLARYIPAAGYLQPDEYSRFMNVASDAFQNLKFYAVN